jgi:hypothetical protein
MERPAFGDRDGLAALAELGSLSATELALECRIEPPAARRWLLDAQSRHLVHSDGAGGGWTVTERGRIAALGPPPAGRDSGDESLRMILRRFD